MNQVQIRWKNCDKSPATEENLKVALASLEEKYAFLEPKIKAEIVAYKNNAVKPFKVRINLFCTCKKTLRSEYASKEINSAVNGCIEKLDDQCRRIKIQKQNSKQKKKGLKELCR